jgi:signal transduction histidine kinase
MDVGRMRALMSTTSWSLKNILTAAVVAMAAIAFGVASSLVILTTRLQGTADMLRQSVHSVRVAEESAINLLLHSRAADPAAVARARAQVLRLLDEAEGFVTTPDEGEQLRAAQRSVDRYFESGRDAASLQDAYGALESLVAINVAQADAAEARIERSRALGGVIGAGATIAFAILVLAVLAWLRRRAFTPVFALNDTMNRFSEGGFEARAPERGAAELRRIAEQFNAMADSLARQRDARVALLAGVAHDLRNPLAALRLSVSLLAADRPLPREDQIRGTAARLQRQIGALDRLVGDFLDMARIEAGQLRLKQMNCDLADVARTAVELFRPLSMAHDLELRLPPQPVMVTCDCMRIEQVANNLLSNAIKYSPGGGRVLIDVAEADGEASLTVRDEGVGIDAEDLEVIFDPFRRAQRSTGGGVQGVGIGLYISRLIVEAHGGRIEAHSAHDRGSEFRVILNTRRAAMESDIVVSARRREARASEVRYGS